MKSLDVILGLIGGLSSIVWGFFLLILGSYESFKLQNSLISSFYTISPLSNEAGNTEEAEPKSPDEAKSALMKAAAEPCKYSFNFSEYIFTRTMQILFCCKCLKEKPWIASRIKRLKRHEDAT